MTARFEVREVREALGLPPSAGETGEGEEPTFESVSSDTRSLEEGALFVALRGERHDGFEFLAEAADRGARGAIVPAGRELPDLPLAWFPVADPRRALGELAAYHRRRSGARVVGVTGSSGKTTVKEMIASALQEEFRVHRTPGNLNNQVGLPLSVLAASPAAEVWVLEMGTNAPGEIARLTEIAAPDDAVVTTVGPAHLEGLGDERGVLREKLSLVAGADEAGEVVVGERPEALPRGARQLRSDAVVAGLGAEADFAPEEHRMEGRRVRFTRAGTEYRVEAGGEHHLRDALLAAALAERLGVAPPAAAAGLARFRPPEMRGEVRDLNGVTVLADCYNANPESLAAAVDYAGEAFSDRTRVAVLGSMLELGEHSERAHREGIRRVAGAGFSLVLGTGGFQEPAAELSGRPGPAEVVPAGDVEEVWSELRARLTGDEVVLVKGSRGARLERIVQRLEAEYGTGAGDPDAGGPRAAGRDPAGSPAGGGG